MIKNVFLDLDDTILDFKRAEAEAIRRTFNVLGIEPSEGNIELYSRINRSCWEKLEAGIFTRDEVLHTRFDMLFEALGAEGDAHATQRIYEHELSLGAYMLGGAEQMLDELYGEYRLYMATNGITAVQTRRIADSGVGKYFDEMFVSEKIGYNKPDKKFFDCCFSKIEDFRHDETVIVGDSLSSDIKGGINAGIRTVYFNPKHKENNTGILPNYEIHSLAELAGILKGM